MTLQKIPEGNIEVSEAIKHELSLELRNSSRPFVDYIIHEEQVKEANLRFARLVDRICTEEE
jgi:hypothetical protein